MSLMKLQQYLAIHRKQVSNVFLGLEVLIIIIWVMFFSRVLSDYDSIFLLIYELGLLLGKTAVVLYILTLTPGIITRLQWFPKTTQPIASIILPFRRHFGILMFMTAFVHMTFTTTFPYYAQYDFKPPTLIPPMAPFQLMGITAWLLLLPLWLTSNDLSQKKLGSAWKALHRLTYFALIFIFLHTAMQKTIWMYVIGTALVLEAISWIRQWQRDAAKSRITPVIQPVTPVASQSTTAQIPPQPPLNPPSSDSSV